MNSEKTALLPSGRARSFASLILLASLGCQTDGSPDRASEVTVADSAGVRIVHNGGSGDAQSGRVERLWAHGFDPGDYTFQTVFHGALRAGGSAVVGDIGRPEVVALDAGGNGHTVLARTGQGPNEVAGIRAVVGAGGQRVWVEDNRNAKLLLFEGDSLATLVSTRETPQVSFGLMSQGVDHEGRLLMTTATFRPEFTEPWFLASLVRFDPGSGVADTVGVFPLAARHTEETWSPYLYSGVVTSGGVGFIHGRTDQPEVIWRSAEGDVVQIARWDQPSAFPTDALWTRLVTGLRADLRRVNPHMGPEQLEEFLNEQLPRYEVDPSAPLPLFGSLHGTPEGGVWMAEFTPGGSWPTRYRVLAPDGVWLGTIEFPGPFRLLDVRDDLVLGVETDEMEIQGVVLYRFAFGG